MAYRHAFIIWLVMAFSVECQVLINPYQFGAPALEFADLGNYNNTTANTVTTTSASYQPQANSLVLAFCWQTHATAVVNPSGFSGNGLTWTRLTTVTFTNNLMNLSVFYASGSSPTSTAGSCTNGQTTTGGGVRVVEFRNADISGGVASAIVQNVTGANNTANPTATFGSAISSSKNAVIYCVVDAVNNTADNADAETRAEAWEVAYNSPTSGSAGYYLIGTSDNSIAHTATTRQWALLGLEIKAK